MRFPTGTARSFRLAETYRTPVMLCLDGMIGQMMEPVQFPTEGRGPAMEDTGWALTGCEGRPRRIVNSLYLTPETLYAHNLKLKAKYDLIARNEVTYDLAGDDEPYDVLVVAFGTTARICRTAIDELRGQGLRAALFRPITLSPYPHQALRRAMDRLSPGGRVLVVEMSMGQMIDDVKIAGEGTRRIEFLGRCGGIVPSPDEVAGEIARMVGETAATAGA